MSVKSPSRARKLHSGGTSYVEWAAKTFEDGKKMLPTGVSIGQAKFKAKMSKKAEFLAEEHDYFKVMGDTKTGESERMTGREALVRNRSYEQKFIRALDKKEPGARLFRWVLEKH